VGGEQALDSYRDKGDQISLVILDLNMPDMGGHKALEEMLAINPEAKIIIASGYSAKGQVKDSLKFGRVGGLCLGQACRHHLSWLPLNPSN
jgi:DNA-binding NarL/FixJ family response regulator